MKIFSQFCTYLRTRVINSLTILLDIDLRCLLYVDFVICNDYGKNKMGTVKPTSSSKAVGLKQKWLRRAKLSAQSATELSGDHLNRMYCLSQNENSCYFSKSQRIHLFERNIVENSEVVRLLIESSSKNSLLNEHSKASMLQIGNKYPFDTKENV